MINRTDDAGFSLVETIIGGALIAGAGLIIMTQQNMATKTKQKMTADQELDALVNDMGRVLADQQHCTLTLKDKKVGDPIDEIKLGEMQLSGFSATYGSPYPASYLDLPLLAGTAYRKDQELGVLGVKIKSMILTEVMNPVTNRPFMDAIKVTFTSDRAPFNEKEIDKYIYVLGTKESGTYTRCISESLSVIEQSMAQMCRGLGAEFSPESKRCQLKNLPEVFMAEESNQCGTVYQEDGTFMVEKVVREKYKYVYFYENKRMPLQCRLYDDYTVSCFCEEGINCPCPAPGARTCRRLNEDRTTRIAQFDVEVLHLTKCVREPLSGLSEI